jgi:hypothetical protein
MGGTDPETTTPAPEGDNSEWADAPFPEHVFIDVAVDQIKERLRISERQAVELLTDAMAYEEVRTWSRKYESIYKGETLVRLTGRYWREIGSDNLQFIDLNEFRRGQGGILLRTRTYHLHYILLSKDDFRCWLDRLPSPATAPAVAPAETKKPAEGAPAPAPIPPKRQSNGLNYRGKDAPLVAEMRESIEAGKARSPEDAARVVMTRAVGTTNQASLVKRLALHYRQTFPAQS